MWLVYWGGDLRRHTDVAGRRKSQLLEFLVLLLTAAASPALRKLPPMDSSWASTYLFTLVHVDRYLAPKA